MTSTIALPGQSLGTSTEYTPSTGTHLYNNQLCASLAGRTSSTSTQPTSSKTKQAAPAPALSILRNPSSTSSATHHHLHTPILPTVGATILGRITRTTPRQALLSILVVNNIPLSSSSSSSTETHQGIIRALDVRATQVDTVKIAESFRPGDVVRAVVISLGDQSNYYLSTAGNELGVVMARSNEGNEMVPASWREMRDLVTGGVEARKVARPM